eukprot:2648689-Prymnesium_polylepis.1
MLKKNVTSSFAKRARPGARAKASRALAVVEQEGDQEPVRQRGRVGWPFKGGNASLGRTEQAHARSALAGAPPAAAPGRGA